MKTNDYALVLGSWLRLPPGDIRRVFADLRRAGMWPEKSERLGAAEAALGLVALLAAHLDGETGPGGCSDAAAMSLVGEPGKDPLEGQPRRVFCDMTGASLGTSCNGYLNFVESVAACLARHKANHGRIAVEGVGLRIHGTEACGFIAAREGGAALEYVFAPGGRAPARDGLRREARLDETLLSGVAYLLSADAARS